MSSAGSTGRGVLEETLRQHRDAGSKLLVPYITGGLGADWLDVLRAVADAGADAIEVGIPFSDPVMDGPVIQEAGRRALEAGVTPLSILDDLRGVDVGVPLVVMTYYNIVFRAGHERFAHMLSEAGVSGTILPDLPIEEASAWIDAADPAGVANVMLVAPTTPDERLVRICGRSRGFLYAVGLMGVTGERDSLASSATLIARRAKAIADLPVLVGVGVSNAAQAAEISAVADGVIVGSALVRRIVEGEGPHGASTFIGGIRNALDSM